MSKLLVLSFALRGFSLGTTVSSLLKNQHFHTDSNSIRNRVNEEPLRGCATSESLFIYLLILFIHNVINLPVTAAVKVLTLDINGVIGSFSVATSFCIRESLIMKFVALVSCKNKIRA